MTHSFRLSIYLDFTDFIDLYIGRYICSSVHPKMKTDFIQTVNLLTIELQLRVELRTKQFIIIFFFWLSFRARFKVFSDGRYWPGPGCSNVE